MSIGDGSSSGSQLLSSSHTSLSQSKKASSEISRIYKHASQLYLTRQLAEAYEVLQPIIQAPSKIEDSPRGEDGPQSFAPIATAGTSQRIKIWSLYVTLLNAVADLDPVEGKRDFGSRGYASIVKSVQSGTIWEDVVRDGYQGREGSVDAEVVYNLSNLLLAQAQDQTANQARLEAYLSSSPGVGMDLSVHLAQRLGEQTYGQRSQISGAATPKDLSSRIKLLELFTLHVLPRNQEWDYAKSFVNNSDILDEERREAFLQTLQELQEASERPVLTDTEDEFGQDYLENSSSQYQDEEKRSHRTSEYAEHGTSTQSSEQAPSFHRRTSSEVDYGIDYGHPNGTANKVNGKGTSNDVLTPMTSLPPTPVVEAVASTDSALSSTALGQSAKQSTSTSMPPNTSSTSMANPSASSPLTSSLRRSATSNNNKQAKPSSSSSRSKPTPSKPSRNNANNINNKNANTNNAVLRQAQHIIYLISSIPGNLSRWLSTNPTILLRMLMFVIAFVAMLSRRNFRERVRTIVERSWVKLKGTVGMGVKVSYV